MKLDMKLDMKLAWTTMKYKIDKDEMYPVYFLTDDSSFGYSYGTKVDIPQDKIYWIKACNKAFYESQEYLEKLYRKEFNK